MPMDLKGKFPHELAEDDPELMRLWGEINNAWDEIERLLYSAFDAMLSEESHFATQAIFYSQKAHAARRDMVESLAKYALLNRPETATKLKNAIKRVKARTGDRNKLAHGTWAISADLATGSKDISRVALSPDIIPNPIEFYSRERLIEVRNSMRDTTEALRSAIDPICSAKRAKLKTLVTRHLQKSKRLE